MSRTYKDRPSRIKWPEDHYRNFGCERITFKEPLRLFDLDTLQSYEVPGEYRTRVRYLQKPGVRSKKKRQYRGWHWMSTPSWWTRLMMNRPQRRSGKLWERRVVNTTLDYLDAADPPRTRKSEVEHIYYW